MSHRNGLKIIECDQDMDNMCKYVSGSREIELYLEI